MALVHYISYLFINVSHGYTCISYMYLFILMWKLPFHHTCICVIINESINVKCIGMCMYFGYLGMHTCMVENDGGASERNKRVSDSLSFIHLPVHV